jgi:hypothetical protein
MRRTLLGLLGVLTLAACSGSVAEFWRPVSEPNLLLSLDKAQMKLDFDLSQCRCGIYPTNVPQPDLRAFNPDQRRYIETSVTRTSEKGESCSQKPSLVVAECMRARGWEVTQCSGRMPVAGGGALCAAAVIDD